MTAGDIIEGVCKCALGSRMDLRYGAKDDASSVERARASHQTISALVEPLSDGNSRTRITNDGCISRGGLYSEEHRVLLMFRTAKKYVLIPGYTPRTTSEAHWCLFEPPTPHK
jgi:hypothetical protein